MNDPSVEHTASTSTGRPKRYWLWPAIIVGMLSAHTLGCLIVVYIATSDPSQVVVANYHEKAIAWDQHQAQQRASDALGWTCAIEAAQEADMLGERSVRISLRDREGEPLTGAKVGLETYNHIRAGDISIADFTEGAPGEYVAMVPMRRPGMWRFDVKATRDQDVFIHHLDQQVGPRNVVTTVPK